ncbi:MAG: hypothetical protein ACREE0_19130 [Phenylobacterium sp.]
MMRFAAAFAALTAAACIAAPLTMGGEGFPSDNLVARSILFYVITAGAYAFLPFVRRGDIAMVTMWLVLAVGITPCVAGRELNAAHMFADMAGVAMSVLPIYIARFRQLVQGDMRIYRRRETDPLPAAE